MPTRTWRRGAAAWDVAVDVAAGTSVGDVAVAAAVGVWKGNRGPPLPMRPRGGHGVATVGADEAVGGGGAEACHYGRSHMTAMEDGASVKVVAQTAASDVAADEAIIAGAGGMMMLRTRPLDNRGGRRLCRRGARYGRGRMSHCTDEAAGWLRCYSCERRCGAWLQMFAGKPLQRSHVAQEPLCFCRCSRRNCRHSHIELHTLGPTQFDPERAKSLLTHTQQFAHFWLANQGRRNSQQQLFFIFLT